MIIPGENWWDGYDLTKVDVSNNEIPAIPEEIGQQGFIQHLNINTNKLQSIPQTIFAMPALKYLDISDN